MTLPHEHREHNHSPQKPKLASLPQLYPNLSSAILLQPHCHSFSLRVFLPSHSINPHLKKKAQIAINWFFIAVLIPAFTSLYSEITLFMHSRQTTIAEATSVLIAALQFWKLSKINIKLHLTDITHLEPNTESIPEREKHPILFQSFITHKLGTEFYLFIIFSLKQTAMFGSKRRHEANHR